MSMPAASSITTRLGSGSRAAAAYTPEAQSPMSVTMPITALWTTASAGNARYATTVTAEPAVPEATGQRPTPMRLAINSAARSTAARGRAAALITPTPAWRARCRSPRRCRAAR